MALESIRVLVPRVRRAVEGVGQPAVLSDDQLKDLVADSIANILLFTGGVFGKQLLVTARDPITNVPTEYATSEPLSLAEGSVVAFEAALQQCFIALREMKISETLRDEGQEWSYQVSPTLLRDQIAYLQAQRDKALQDAVPPTAVGWVNLVDSWRLADHALLELCP